MHIFTCSVYPDLTQLWYHVLSRTFRGGIPRTLIFDCGGNLRAERFPGADVRRVPNLEHGRKIDLALGQMSDAEFVLVLDDDVFPLNHTIIERAISTLRAQRQMAAYSFLQRDWWKIPAAGALHVPMGSYALLVRRGVILEEGLSFETRRTSDPAIRSGTGYWDTADYCQKELLERGYTIGYAPEEDRIDIPTFFGTSGGFLTFARKSLLGRRYVRRRSRRRAMKEVVADQYAFQRACSICAVKEVHRRLLSERPSFDDWFSEGELRGLGDAASDDEQRRQYLATADRVFEIRDRLLSA